MFCYKKLLVEVLITVTIKAEKQILCIFNNLSSTYLGQVTLRFWTKYVQTKFFVFTHHFDALAAACQLMFPRYTATWF